MRALVSRADDAFDRLYGSRWNPAHQSGSLVVALMLLVIVTGIYLLLFYRISEPYESMQRIQGQAWGGRWLRALHRYASDLAVVFTALHVLRMMAEGRTWGPRVLAWVSGLCLLAAMMVVGWTGYVLVWDTHARLLGASGARLMDAAHLLATPIGRIFDGASPVSASFIFLNLFIHMSLPLGMVLLLWVHTLRLARSRWLPERPVILWAGLALTALSVLMPATLGPAADGLLLGDRALYDLFFTAWIPIATRLSAGLAWTVTLLLVLLPLTLPLWWRADRQRRGETSSHHPDACSGCGQCVIDCPFEAIAMVADPRGLKENLIASVDPGRCVSCGLCAGSCDRLAIGPASRDGHAQTRAVHVAASRVPPDSIALVSCVRDGVGERLTAGLRERGHAVLLNEIDCAGALHALTVARLLHSHRGVFVLACPPRRCGSREGADLALDRLLGGREPVLKQPFDRTRVRFVNGSRVELRSLVQAFEHFSRACGQETRDSDAPPRARRTWGQRAIAVIGTTLALALVARASQLEVGSSSASGAVRLAWRLPGQARLECRPLSEAEIAKLPAHMRRTEECRTVYLHYSLRIWADGRIVLDREVAPLGARGDRPLYVDHDVALPPGAHQVRVEFVPKDDPDHAGITLAFEDSIQVRAGRAGLITLDPVTRRLVAR